MNNKLKIAFQVSIVTLAIILPVFSAIKAYNTYQEWALWKKGVTAWIENPATPSVNTVPILVTIVCQHYKEDCLKFANQAR